MAKSKVELIFEKWKAELANKDRSLPCVAENFDELFSNWYRSKVSFDDAYALLDTAIKAHLPNDSVARGTFKRMKKNGVMMFKTESEFVTDWKTKISDTAKQMFYSIYPIDGAAENTDDVKYGSMSAQEYRKQRRYIESHPLLDWTKIKHEPIDEEVNFDDIDVDVDLGDL